MEARNGSGGEGYRETVDSGLAEGGEGRRNVERSNAGAGSVASIGTVHMVLESAKKDIIREIRERSGALHKDFEQKVDAVSKSVFQQVLSGVSSQALMTSSRSRSSEEKKRKVPPSPDKLPFFDLLLRKDRTSFVVQWTILTTLYSFAQVYPSTLDWIPRVAKDLMTPQSKIFEEASGLSVLFFAVEPGQKWTRYHGKVGKLWSFVLISSICSTILHVRASEFDTTRTSEAKKVGRSVPEWMSSFGGKRETAGVVTEIIECLETTEAMMRQRGDSDMARRRKRMRAQDETPGGAFEAERDFAVARLLSVMLQTWTYGRSEARKVLFASVMFLVHKIRSYDSVAEAIEDGYEIVFHEMSTSDEADVPRDICGTIWDVPLACVRDGTEDELRDENNERLAKLSDNFPSLRLTLRYRRAVEQMDNAVDSGAVPAFWNADETLSLHQLALTVLTASLSGKSVKSVLQTSTLSLRTIHILAIALRGLIRQSIGMEQSFMEKIAAAGVTCEPIEKHDGDRVTTFPGSRNGSRQGRACASAFENIRTEKFKMSLTAFRTEELKRIAARQEQARSTRSEGGQVKVAAESDSDLEQNWLEGISFQ